MRAAAGWATLGRAGRRHGRRAVYARGRQWGGQRLGRVLAAAAARRGDARLGTLAGTVNGCVEAVGPGAALAAARPDGTLAAYATVEEFVGRGMATNCPITLVDAGDRSDEVITRLAADDTRTLIVTGIGPAPGSDDPALQVFYRVGTTFPGWATSASTRRTGIVTLTDLTRTLVERADGAPSAATIYGSPCRAGTLARRGPPTTWPPWPPCPTRFPARPGAGSLRLCRVGVVGALPATRWSGRRDHGPALPVRCCSSRVRWDTASRPRLTLP